MIQPGHRVCLIVLFNHKFERNLPVLREVYGPRFSELRFIMPFYRGSDADVTGVYENSAQFQGYLSQAWRDLPREGISHYAVVGDDLILNPLFDEFNLPGKLGLDDRTGFIKSLIPLSDLSANWPHMDVARRSVIGSNYVNHRGEIPSPEEAAELLKRHGVAVGALGPRNLRGWGGKVPDRYQPVAWHNYPGFGHWVIRMLRNRGRIKLEYPLLMTYSDFFVIPAAAMDRFLHYCGVFAAMRTFVEVAIPTALAMACETMRCEADTPFRGGEVWSEEEKKAIEDRYGLSLARLLGQFPPELLHIHPVKLSRWNGQGMPPARTQSPMLV